MIYFYGCFFLEGIFYINFFVDSLIWYKWWFIKEVIYVKYIFKKNIKCIKEKVSYVERDDEECGLFVRWLCFIYL